MKIGVIGAGRIGGNCARQAVKGGHEVMLSFARDPSKLEQLAAELGDRASAGAVADAVEFGEVVILSVPWGAIPEALAQAGDLTGKVVIDTTNQFGSGPKPDAGADRGRVQRAAHAGRAVREVVQHAHLGHSRRRRPVATGDDRVVQWMCGDDPQAKQLVAGLIEDMGYVPVDLGGTATCAAMEAPRRPGAVYGEEYRAADAQAVVDAVRDGAPIPPTPAYE